MFWGNPELLKTSARPRREPDVRSLAKIWIPGQMFGSRGQTQKRCAPKKHAGPRSRICKWSHMVQVMTQNHLAPLAPKTLSNKGDQGYYNIMSKGKQGTNLETGLFLQTPVSRDRVRGGAQFSNKFPRAPPRPRDLWQGLGIVVQGLGIWGKA